MQLINFKFNGMQVRTVDRNGQVWFVLKDICDVLELRAPDVRQRLHHDVVSNHTVKDSLGRSNNALIINEDGLYDVIFESRKPEARSFRKWVTSEVLPTIRKTGSYSIERPKTQAELLLAYAKQFVEMEQRVDQVEKTVTTIRETIINRDEDWRNWIKKAFNSTVMHSSEKDFQAIRSESYELLERRARCNLNARLRNLRKRLEEEGATKTKINSVNRMDVIEADPRLKEIYTGIVKELSIRLMPSVVN